jgi:radical SAM protein (TIGR01212 family)
VEGAASVFGAAFAHRGLKERALEPKETKRYRTLRSFLEERYPFPVRPLSVDAGTGPTPRVGPSQAGSCLYCYSPGNRGSVKGPPGTPVEQVKQGLSRLRRRQPSVCAIVSFPPASSADAPLDSLKRLYGETLETEGVVGIAVGMKPECLTEDALRLFEGMAKTHDVWLEMGPQAVHDEQRAAVDRCHISEAWAEAVEQAAGRSLHQVAHLMLGLPGEGTPETLETVKEAASHPIDGVMLHHLMVVDDTELSDLWRRRHFTLIPAEAYIDLVVAILEHLPPEVVMHRLVSPPHPRERLLAPRWRQSAEEMLVAIDAEMARRDTRQGARTTRR